MLVVHNTVGNYDKCLILFNLNNLILSDCCNGIIHVMNLSKCAAEMVNQRGVAVCGDVTSFSSLLWGPQFVQEDRNPKVASSRVRQTTSYRRKNILKMGNCQVGGRLWFVLKNAMLKKNRFTCKISFSSSLQSVSVSEALDPTNGITGKSAVLRPVVWFYCALLFKQCLHRRFSARCALQRVCV